jgi:hypothetical protein
VWRRDGRYRDLRRCIGRRGRGDRALDKAERVRGDAAGDPPDAGEYVGAHPNELASPTGVGHADAQEAAIEGHDLGAPGEPGSDGRWPDRAEKSERPLGAGAEEARREVGLRGTIHGRPALYVILAFRVLTP